MIRVEKLIELLKLFPPEAWVYPYQGECDAIIVLDERRNEVGAIHANETERESDPHVELT